MAPLGIPYEWSETTENVTITVQCKQRCIVFYSSGYLKINDGEGRFLGLDLAGRIVIPEDTIGNVLTLKKVEAKMWDRLTVDPNEVSRKELQRRRLEFVAEGEEFIRQLGERKKDIVHALQRLKDEELLRRNEERVIRKETFLAANRVEAIENIFSSSLAIDIESETPCVPIREHGGVFVVNLTNKLREGVPARSQGVVI